ncbi:MAG: type II toxin-antitoxin system death-on-curing family toxin [Patescibacteria group bacterium]|jgi:death-on-curing family protein
MPKAMATLTVAEVEYLAHKLAQEHLTFNEPIPDFSTRYPGKLESCLAMPFQKFSKKSLYQGLLGKVAMMFYLMVKNHPFQNGNKRIAMTSVFVLLHKNDKWLQVDTKELYNFAVWVAESNSRLKDEVVSAIEKFFKSYVKEL